MSSFPPPGWYPDPHQQAPLRWWDGARWSTSTAAAPISRTRPQIGFPLNPISVSVCVAVLIVAFGAAAGGGFGSFVVVVAFAALVLALITLARGGLKSFGIETAKRGVVLLGVSSALLLVGALIAAPTSSPIYEAARVVASSAPQVAPSANPQTLVSPIENTEAVVEASIVTIEEPIPFAAVTVEDPSAASGTSSLTTAGVDGVLEVAYRVTTINGVETGRVRTGERVLVAPVDQVTTVGTRVQQAAPAAGSGCDPNYSGCVPVASDVDCAGGGGNGPAYLSGTASVVGRDIYDLDRDGDGIACDS